MQASLIYVMGPSGAGKDSLLSATKTLLQGAPVAFVRRYITRPAARGEWHIPVSEERFAHLEEDGAFRLPGTATAFSTAFRQAQDLPLQTA